MSEPTVKVTCNPCLFCGKGAEVEMPVSAAKAWQSGVHLQRAWPESTPGQRELLISGTHPECWDKYMKEEEE